MGKKSPERVAPFGARGASTGPGGPVVDAFGSGNDRDGRVCGGQGLGAVGRWRVDPDAVDLALDLLAFFTDETDLAIPAFGEGRTPATEVQAGHVLGLAVGQWLYIEQAGGRVVAGRATQGDGVLAGHGGIV